MTKFRQTKIPSVLKQRLEKRHLRSAVLLLFSKISLFHKFFLIMYFRYDGLPGFRRLSMVKQIVTIAKVACMFPFYSMMYIIAPTSPVGRLAKKPFIKFICHSASYMVFLFLLAAASQQVDKVSCKIFGE